MTRAAAAHVRGMEAAYESLTERYRGGRLSVNACELAETEGTVEARFEYVEGVPLLEVMDGCLERGDTEAFRRLFRQFAERVGYNSDYPASDFDLVFGNVLIRPRPGKDGGLEGFLEGEWTLIDYEWTFGKPMDTRRLAFRAAYWYLLEDERRNKIGLDWILRECAMTEKDVKE